MSSVSHMTRKAKMAIGALPGVRTVYGTAYTGCTTIECETEEAATQARNRLIEVGMEVGDIGFYPNLKRWIFGAMSMSEAVA